MSFLCGIDFRGSSGGATDPTNCTYTTGGNGDADNGDFYPTTRGGFTFGMDAGATAGSDRTGASDARLKGINYNSTTGGTFRVDLPNAGTYRVYLALGDAEGGLSATQDVVIKDNTTTVLTLSALNMGALGTNVYYDATGTSRTESAWVSQSTYGGSPSSNLTFATTTFNLVISAASGFWGIAHLFIEEVIATDPRTDGLIVFRHE